MFICFFIKVLYSDIFEQYFILVGKLLNNWKPRTKILFMPTFVLDEGILMCDCLLVLWLCVLYLYVISKLCLRKLFLSVYISNNKWNWIILFNGSMLSLYSSDLAWRRLYPFTALNALFCVTSISFNLDCVALLHIGIRYDIRESMWAWYIFHKASLWIYLWSKPVNGKDKWSDFGVYTVDMLAPIKFWVNI